MKYFSLIIVFSLISINGFSQSQETDSLQSCSDTIVFKCKYRTFQKDKFSMSMVYYFKGKLYYKPNVFVRHFAHPYGTPDGGGNIFCCGLTYYKFYSGSRLIAEGNWCNESFFGKYISYYRNGHKKAEGRYFSECKVGNWKFYNKKEELVGEKKYPEKCSTKPQGYLGDKMPR